MRKRLFSILLAQCMVLCLMPTTAFAEDSMEETAVCTCEMACTEETMNAECPICSAEGAPLTDCAQVNAQDDTNNEQQTANAENGFKMPPVCVKTKILNVLPSLVYGTGS